MFFVLNGKVREILKYTRSFNQNKENYNHKNCNEKIEQASEYFLPHKVLGRTY